MVTYSSNKSCYNYLTILTPPQKITASADASKVNMAKTHNAGASALVMHRGQENVKSPLAVGLLFSVRSQLVCTVVSSNR